MHALSYQNQSMHQYMKWVNKDMKIKLPQLRYDTSMMRDVAFPAEQYRLMRRTIMMKAHAFNELNFDGFIIKDADFVKPTGELNHRIIKLDFSDSNLPKQELEHYMLERIRDGAIAGLVQIVPEYRDKVYVMTAMSGETYDSEGEIIEVANVIHMISEDLAKEELDVITALIMESIDQILTRVQRKYDAFAE